jgi:peptidoglycan/LPS O-acetylase OafA/YrhL
LFTRTHFIPDPVAILHESIFLSNYLSSYSGWLWSLCVEEHFYLFLSILFYILVRWGKLRFKPLLTVYLLLFTLGFCCRLYNYWAYDSYSFERDYAYSHIRFDALFAGVLLYWIYNYRRDLIEKILSGRLNAFLLVTGSLYLLTDFIFPRETTRWLSVINLSVHPWIFGLILINFLEYKNTRIDTFIRPMAYVGKYSYSIYLFQGLINGLLESRFQGTLYYLLFFSLAIVTGILLSKTIEYPFLRLRDRWFPSRSKQLVGAPVREAAGREEGHLVPGLVKAGRSE